MGFKKYKSHKVVNAAKIVSWSVAQVGSSNVDVKDAGGVILGMQDILMVDEDGGHHRAGQHLFARGTPENDSFYLVKYEDGYVSWCPKGPFEAGYTEVFNGEIKGDREVFSFDYYSKEPRIAHEGTEMEVELPQRYYVGVGFNSVKERDHFEAIYLQSAVDYFLQ